MELSLAAVHESVHDCKDGSAAISGRVTINFSLLASVLRS
jgi:hypothetical protein